MSKKYNKEKDHIRDPLYEPKYYTVKTGFDLDGVYLSATDVIKLIQLILRTQDEIKFYNIHQPDYAKEALEQLDEDIGHVLNYLFKCKEEYKLISDELFKDNSIDDDLEEFCKDAFNDGED